MTVMLMNIPLGVLFVALVSGIPLWHVLKHPDRKPEAVPEATAAVPAVRDLRAYYDDGAYRRAA